MHGVRLPCPPGPVGPQSHPAALKRSFSPPGPVCGFLWMRIRHEEGGLSLAPGTPWRG